MPSKEGTRLEPQAADSAMVSTTAAVTNRSRGATLVLCGLLVGRLLVGSLRKGPRFGYWDNVCNARWENARLRP